MTLETAGTGGLSGARTGRAPRARPVATDEDLPDLLALSPGLPAAGGVVAEAQHVPAGV